MKNSLNRAYRLVWNELTGTYVAVAETTRARGKRASGALRCVATAALLALGGQAAHALDGGTLPSGASIAAGSATLSQSGNSLNVQQQSQKLVINWNSFDIGSAASVSFSQPASNAIALNRVNSGVPTEIQGSLTANGNVWVLNSAGVVFGASARVNVGGLVASSLQLSDSDFLAGTYSFSNAGSAGSVSNAGSLTASGGVVALIAPVVRNSGSIQAGSVALAAGDQVTLDFSGDGLLGFTIDRAALDALVENSGSIRGDSVTLSARSASAAVATVVNNEGVIEATGLSEDGGRIVLDGGSNGAVHVAGTLDASSSAAQGGSITVTGQQITLDGGATLNANGATGGGRILVGGGYQGADSSLLNATTVSADSTVKATASATDTGNGGQVVFWSDDTTTFAGRIEVRGGAQGGNGGLAEVSGKQSLRYSGITDARADQGNTGELLLDPASIAIIAGSGSGDISGSTVYVNDLEAQLANVTLQATGNITVADLALNGGDGRLSMANNVSLRLEAGTTGNGSISFSNANNTIEVFGTSSLYLQAGGTGSGTLSNVANLIAWGSGTNPSTLPTHSVSTVGSGTPSAGSVTLYGADGVTVGGSVTTNGGYVRIWADSDNASGGGLTLSAPVSTNGGNLYISAGTGEIALNSSMTLGAGRLYFKADGSYTTGTRVLGGVLSASGDVDIDTPFTMNAGASILTDGAITFSSTVNLNTGTGVLTLRGSAIDFSGATLNNLSTASIRLEPADASTSMVVGDSNGFVSASKLSLLSGIKNLTIGREDGTGTISLASDFSFSASGALELVNKTIDISAGTLTNTSGNITLSGDNINIVKTVTANGGAGTVTLRQEGAGTALHLGSSLASSSISEVNAATLVIGRSNGGHVVFDGDISTNASAVHIISGGKVEGINGGVSAENVAVTATGGATLSDSTFDFSTLALNVGGNTRIATGNTSGWGLGTVNGVSGLTIATNTATEVTLVSQGSLGLNSSLNLGSGASTLNLRAASFDANSTTLSGQSLAKLSFDLVDQSQTFTVGASTSTLSQTELAKFNGTRDIVIGSAGTNIVAEGALSVTVGRELELVGDSLTLPYAITVNGGSLHLNSLSSALALNAALTAGDGVILESDDQNISGSAVISASKLAIEAGSGDVALSGTQQVSTLAAQAGSLSLTNGKSLSVGTVDGVTGITVGKTVDLRLSGSSSDLTLAQDVHAANSGNATTAILLAAGRNFINNAGADALQADAGRWLVYSTSPTADTRGGLSPDFKQYNANTSSTVLGSGNGLLYTVAPTISVSLTGTTSKVYDGTTDATLSSANYASSGAIDGDTVSYTVGGSARYADKNAGSAKTVSVDGLALSGASNGSVVVYGYTLSSTTASGNIGTITAKTLSAAAGSVQDKVYDGTTSATLDNVTLAGIVAGDSVAVSGTGSASFADKNVGNAKTVSISGLSLSGADAANYVLDANTTASITPRTLTVGADVASKVYDGTTAATLNSVSLSNVVAGDSVSASGSASFLDKNAGSNKAVDLSLLLSGSDAGNYVIGNSSAIATTAAISAKTLNAGAVSVATKVYDGNTTANVSGGALSGVVDGDSVATTLAGSYADKNAGSGKTVSVSLGLSGADAANYVLAANSTSTTGDITAKTLTAGAVSVATKVYDGNTTANVSGGALSGVVDGDSVASTLAGTYADKNAGSGKTVSVSLGLSGADAANYVLASSATTATGDISAKTLTAGAVSVATKVYDGNTTANVSGGALSGVVDGDSVASTLAGSYADKNAGSGKTVSVSLGLSGADAANYVLASSATTATGDISAKTLTAGAVSVATKVYDGNTTANVSGGALSGVVAGDSVATTLAGSYDNAAIGLGKTVTVQLGLSGTDASNYQLAATQTTSSGAIAASPATAALDGLQIRSGNGNGTQSASTGAGGTGSAGGGGAELLPGSAGQSQLFGSGSGAGAGTGSDAAGNAASGSGSGNTNGAGGNGSNGGSAGEAGAGNGNASATGSDATLSGSQALQLSTEGEFSTADGVSIRTGVTASGAGDVVSETVLPIFVADAAQGLSFQGQYKVLDQGSSLSLQRHSSAASGSQGGQPQLKEEAVSLRTQAWLPQDGGERALLQLTLLADGTLLVQAPDGLAGMSRDTLSAYALSALKQAAGVGASKVRAIVLRFATGT
jgi:filamentous hemagglutinin family protein